MNLSLAEMNEFRVCDLFDLGHSYFGEEDGSPKEATQSDIDAFYGR